MDDVKMSYFLNPYGDWRQTSIGGLSLTHRLEGVIRVNERETGPIVLFSVHGPDEHSVSDFFDQDERVTIGESSHDIEYGNVTEIIVHEAKDVECVAAQVARLGAIPKLDDEDKNMKRSLGIERQDRINSECVNNDLLDTDFFGLRRGMENWRFPWIPDSWEHIPITWDHLVENMNGVPLEHIRQPLNQHVLLKRILRGRLWCVGKSLEANS